MSTPLTPDVSHSRYRYDALDVITHCASGAQPATQRFYQKKRLSLELQGEHHQRLLHRGSATLAQQQLTPLGVATTLLATDQQGSVTHTQQGNVSEHRAYGPYGQQPTANGLGNLSAFTGERPEALTGHYLLGNGYRAFAPHLARFHSPDSWSPFGKGGLNAYAYCVGDPINHRDPNGHNWLDVFNLITSSAGIMGASAAFKASNGFKAAGISFRIKPNLENCARLIAAPMAFTGTALTLIRASSTLAGEAGMGIDGLTVAAGILSSGAAIAGTLASYGHKLNKQALKRLTSSLATVESNAEPRPVLYSTTSFASGDTAATYLDLGDLPLTPTRLEPTQDELSNALAELTPSARKHVIEKAYAIRYGNDLALYQDV